MSNFYCVKVSLYHDKTYIITLSMVNYSIAADENEYEKCYFFCEKLEQRYILPQGSKNV